MAASSRELSGITPSGPLTLGNYLGALRRFREHQDDGYYFVANLHALTTAHQPRQLRELTLSTAALFFASGLDPARATVFLQSDVPAHVELGYLLECTAHVGELGRMIQFKEKGGQPGTRASLFTYPCLMAADILLYDALHVPVGGDQSQHVELARDLAQRFNAAYGPTFTVPELVPAAVAARVRDLADPSTKMSKSAPPAAPGVIRMTDSADVIRRKIRRAVTDSDGELRYDPVTKPGVANLAEVVAALTAQNPETVLAQCGSYGDLKDTCVDVVDAELAPIRRRHDDLINDEEQLRRLLALGAQRAHATAQPVLQRARDAIGVAALAAKPAQDSTVVRLTAVDAPEVLTLQRAAYVTEAQAHGDLELPPLQQSLPDLASELAADDILALGVRDSRGRLTAAGRALVRDTIAYIGRLAVVPDQQGRGIGSRLLASLEAQLPTTVHQLRLFTGDRSHRNLRLYARLGYVETSREATPAGYCIVHLSKHRTAAADQDEADVVPTS